MIKRFLTVALVMLCLSALASAQSSLSDIQGRGVLRVGTELGYLPFDIKDKHGNAIGFDPAFITGFAESIGVEVEFIDTPWDDLIPDLNAGKFDIIVSGMTVTTDRKKLIDFTAPYFAGGQALLINKRMQNQIKSFRDINRPGIRIISKEGTTAGNIAKTFFNKADVTLLDIKEDDILQALLDGKADVFVYDMPYFAVAFPGHEDKLVFLPDVFTYEPFAAAVKKGNTTLANAVSAYIQKIRDNGTYAELFSYWITGSEWMKDLP